MCDFSRYKTDVLLCPTFDGDGSFDVFLKGLLGIVVASVTAEQEVLGSIPGSDKVLLGFSTRNFSVAVTESGFVPD